MQFLTSVVGIFCISQCDDESCRRVEEGRITLVLFAHFLHHCCGLLYYILRPRKTMKERNVAARDKHKVIESVVLLVLLIMVIPATTKITTAIAAASNLVNKIDEAVSPEAILLQKKGN